MFGMLRFRENSILHVYGNKKEKAMDKNNYNSKRVDGFEVNKPIAEKNLN
jgi:hypothetical protein